MTAKIKETAMRLVFALAAVLSVLAVIFICIFLFAGGAPAFRQIGVLPFLTGQNWRPLQNEFGIFPMIIGSIYVTAGAIVVGVPLGIGTAVFLARFCPAPLYRVLKPAVNLLAGIPSIVYGFFGLTVLVPAVQALFGTSGKGVLTASLVLGIMILPTIINVSESALRAVPNSYYEGALALGATKERAVLGTLLPAAKSGVSAAIWDEVKDKLKKSALALSGGQQQRLCSARALAVEPDVLLMDEPTSALDPISTAKIEELALELKKKYTIAIVTHNMQQAARISDQTAFFLLGEMVECAPTKTLFDTPTDPRTRDYITGRFG